MIQSKLQLTCFQYQLVLFWLQVVSLKMMVTSKSTSHSMMIKSARKVKDSTLKKNSYKTPTRFIIVWSTIKSLIKVGLSDPKSNCLNFSSGIRLILAPNSHNTLLEIPNDTWNCEFSRIFFQQENIKLLHYNGTNYQQAQNSQSFFSSQDTSNT